MKIVDDRGIRVPENRTSGLISAYQLTIMVIRDTERRARPEYSLDRIRELARDGKVSYGSSTVQRDVENLGYAPEDVHRCLEVLNSLHFSHAERYAKAGPWLDVYCVSCQGPRGHLDPLYIKLKLNRDCIVVVLGSFHRER